MLVHVFRKGGGINQDLQIIRLDNRGTVALVRRVGNPAADFVGNLTGLLQAVKIHTTGDNIQDASIQINHIAANAERAAGGVWNCQATQLHLLRLQTNDLPADFDTVNLCYFFEVFKGTKVRNRIA